VCSLAANTIALRFLAQRITLRVLAQKITLVCFAHKIIWRFIAQRITSYLLAQRIALCFLAVDSLCSKPMKVNEHLTLTADHSNSILPSTGGPPASLLIFNKIPIGFPLECQ